MTSPFLAHQDWEQKMSIFHKNAGWIMIENIVLSRMGVSAMAPGFREATENACLVRWNKDVNSPTASEFLICDPTPIELLRV